jgi:hypothetical protein
MKRLYHLLLYEDHSTNIPYYSIIRDRNSRPIWGISTKELGSPRLVQLTAVD